ncbi:thioesterase family protein [Roseicyclus sp. F158]|uniref:Thioesterase family protein n=1 Tax=Tropicimonas omnivorans TaxID=3075590 RepID=A0ABU3DD41_9RHOB|nr:thioesterase family protein [Roseicyclus sp. F158]MDT0681635.1 thioesterase family protein [Roseicyclus sp. F158]
MPFEISKPMRFGDCDLTGIAYHPAYLSMLVDVNEAMFASIGITWKEIMLERNLGMPVLKMNIEFYKPAFYGDMLDFSMHIRRIGNSSMDLETIARVKGEAIWKVSERVVLTSTDTHKSLPWPDDMRQGLQRYLDPAEE